MKNRLIVQHSNSREENVFLLFNKRFFLIFIIISSVASFGRYSGGTGGKAIEHKERIINVFLIIVKKGQSPEM